MAEASQDLLTTAIVRAAESTWLAIQGISRLQPNRVGETGSQPRLTEADLKRLFKS